MPDALSESQRLLAQLRFPCGDVPEPGDIKNVAPGIHWLRMPLPFQLNHINLWLIEEKDGWTIVDTGINSQDTRALWEKIFAEKLGGKPVVRVIGTHLHPDHIGLAGWLCEKWNAPLYMTLGEYMSAQAARNDFVESAPSTSSATACRPIAFPTSIATRAAMPRAWCRCPPPTGA